jgi:hypothetical protein
MTGPGIERTVSPPHAYTLKTSGSLQLIGTSMHTGKQTILISKLIRNSTSTGAIRALILTTKPSMRVPANMFLAKAH